MPYAVLEREIEKLDAEQQNSVVMFVRFLLSQKAAATPLAEPRTKALQTRTLRSGSMKFPALLHCRAVRETPIWFMMQSSRNRDLSMQQSR